MLAILDQVDLASGLQTDNTAKYLNLMLLKLLLDAGAFYLCSPKLYTYIFPVCSLSIVVADVVLTSSLAAVWFVGADQSPVQLCFVLSTASATFGALPLPLMFLGSLEYCLHNSYLCNHSTRCKYVRNAALVSLGWLLALIYSQSHVKAEPRETSCPRLKALVCEVKESVTVSLFGLTLFAALICAMLPFLPHVPQWIQEANRLCQARREEKSHSSDLFIWNDCERQKEQHLVRTNSERPPLSISLALGFGNFFIPYLTISVISLLLNLSVPSYITVNVLWLECVNSFLMGFVFWIKSNKDGPYTQLPDNVCLWSVYWHLSNGTRDQELPIAVFNPSKAKRSNMFFVWSRM